MVAEAAASPSLISCADVLARGVLRPPLMQNESLALLLAHVAWLGPLGIFGTWLWLGSDMTRRGRFLLIASGVLLVQAIAGAVAGYVDSNTTMLGAALVYSSTSWMLVPALTGCFGEHRLVLGIPLGFITPVAGAASGILCAVMTGAINPCG